MAPGKRNRWTLAPGMLFKDGKLFMVVGGAGAESTMWGIAQPIVNAIDFGMDPQAALYAPRFRYGDIYHYTGGTETWLEPGIKPDVRDALIAARPYHVARRQAAHPGARDDTDDRDRSEERHHASAARRRRAATISRAY